MSRGRVCKHPYFQVTGFALPEQPGPTTSSPFKPPALSPLDAQTAGRMWLQGHSGLAPQWLRPRDPPKPGSGFGWCQTGLGPKGLHVPIPVEAVKNGDLLSHL